MWIYEKKLQHPVKISKCDPAMAKGLTFTAEELGELRRLLENLDLPTEDLPD